MGINLTNFFHFNLFKAILLGNKIFVYLASVKSTKDQSQVVRIKKAVISYNNKGLLKIVLADYDEITHDDVLEQRKVVQDLTQGQPHVVLAIAGRRTSATKEAREYSSANIPEGRLAEAVLIKSLPVRIMGKFYINFNKPLVPTQLFDNENEALTWLNTRLFEAGVS